MIEQLQKLLNDVRSYTLANEKFCKDKLARGDAFNLFSELRMTTDEVRLHSLFLSMLLNPFASHGQGDKFLKPFISMIEEKTKHTLLPMIMDTLKTSVYVEKDIGPVDNEHGGRIDICIEDKNGYQIIIENKIYAGDQPKQMKRYWNYAQKKCNQDANRYRLIYLTLDGHEPSDDSTCGLESKDYICISYKDDIITWLNKCVELSVRQPLLRETLIQYIDTLKKLTYSDMENSSEILSYMSKSENLDATFFIANNIDKMISNIINDTLYPQLHKIAESKGLELKFEKKHDWMTEKFLGWSFEHPNWKNFRIRMEFEERCLGYLIIGFNKKEDKKREDIKCWHDLWERTTTNEETNPIWIWKDFPKPEYRRWNNAQSLRAIIDGEMVNSISVAIDELLDCAEGLDM